MGGVVSRTQHVTAENLSVDVVELVAPSPGVSCMTPEHCPRHVNDILLRRQELIARTGVDASAEGKSFPQVARGVCLDHFGRDPTIDDKIGDPASLVWVSVTLDRESGAVYLRTEHKYPMLLIPSAADMCAVSRQAVLGEGGGHCRAQDSIRLLQQPTLLGTLKGVFEAQRLTSCTFGRKEQLGSGLAAATSRRNLSRPLCKTRVLSRISHVLAKHTR